MPAAVGHFPSCLGASVSSQEYCGALATQLDRPAEPPGYSEKPIALHCSSVFPLNTSGNSAPSKHPGNMLSSLSPSSSASSPSSWRRLQTSAVTAVLSPWRGEPLNFLSGFLDTDTSSSFGEKARAGWDLSGQANPLGLPRPLFTPKSQMGQHSGPGVSGGLELMSAGETIPVLNLPQFSHL